MLTKKKLSNRISSLGGDFRRTEREMTREFRGEISAIKESRRADNAATIFPDDRYKFNYTHQELLNTILNLEERFDRLLAYLELMEYDTPPATTQIRKKEK